MVYSLIVVRQLPTHFSPLLEVLAAVLLTVVRRQLLDIRVPLHIGVYTNVSVHSEHSEKHLEILNSTEVI